MVRDHAPGLELWLRRLVMRSPLDAEDKARVLALDGQIREFRAGEEFIRVGQPTDHVSLVVEGLVGQFSTLRNGMRRIVALHLPGEIANLPSVVLPNACCAQVALNPTVVYSMPRSSVRALLRLGETLATALWRDCCVDAAIAERWLVLVAGGNAQARLAHLLCELAIRQEVLGASRPAPPVPLTQAQIGDVLGLTAVHVNRVLRSLRECGALVREGHRHLIQDWELLAHIAEFEPSYLHLAG